ncbi:MAG: ABC transporter permease [Mesorhizobium sp.]|uniref:ABC transporter permease n=1 Tax=Mesorhizobium sp. TaxID=1871066 RepID=UPI000FE97250|nr:ABC transporter permease [Mesorhizobium sp.]RWN49231.1 MAG: ABC transporter permease [Mesorhizobium sp.]
MSADRFRKWLMYAYAATLLAFIILPLLIVIPMSLTSSNSLAFPTPGWSLRWYAELWVDQRWPNALWNSVVIGLSTTVLALVLGIPAGIGLAWGDFAGKRILYAIIAAPLVTPVVIVGVAAFSFFATLGLVGNKLSIILVHTAMAVPVMLTTVVASLSTFDRTLVRAAASLGAGTMRTFFKVVLPLIAPGVITGAIIAFIISFDEVVVASFLSTGAERTLPRMIFSGVRESISPAIAAVAVLLIAFSATLLGVIAILQSRSQTLRARASA